MRLDEIRKLLEKAHPGSRKEIERLALDATAHMKWVPNPGPQTDAYFSEADEIFFGGQAGGGKDLCVQTLTPVPYFVDPSGFKKHGDLVPGDFVYTDKGVPTEILAVTPKMVKDDAYIVEFDTGEKITAGRTHLWNTLTEYDRDRILRTSEAWRAKRKTNRPSRAVESSKKPWVSLNVTLRNQQKEYSFEPVVSTSKTTQEILETLLSRRGAINHSIGTSEPLYSPEVGLPIEPYLFGLWIGDGFSNAPSIGMLKEDLDCLMQFLPLEYSIYARREEGVRDFDVVRFPGMLKGLKHLGVRGNKRIPPIYLRASIEQRKALLQGILDTDGHCTDRGQIECGFSKEDLALDLLELVSSLGIKATLRRKKARAQTGKGKDHFRIKFMCDFPAFRLPRKLERQKLTGHRDTTKRRYIVAITPAPAKTVTNCIKVADPSGLYLVGRTMIPTHNSDLEIGLAINEHDRSLLLRRTNHEADGLIERMATILGTRDGYNSQKGIWRLPHNGYVVEVGGCQLETDKQKYKGNPHSLICVGRDTPVLMADGCYRKISDVRTGDMVATLEGPRRVKKSFPVEARPSVLLAVRLPSGDVHRQVQSTTHKVLSRMEWVAPGTQDASHGLLSVLTSTQCCSQSESFSTHRLRPALTSRVLNKLSALVQSIGRLLRVAPWSSGILNLLGWSAYKGRAPQENANVVSDGLHREMQPQPLCFRCPLTLSSRQRPLDALYALYSFLSYGGSDAQKKSSLPDFLDDYQSLSRFYDGHILAHKASYYAPTVYPLNPPQQDGVEEQNPIRSRMDAQDRIHARNPRTLQYVHPYTMEIRQTCCELSLASWMVTPIGSVELFDIEVEEVNHFITKGGIVNKNCFDEVSDFTESQYVFIGAWNRSANPKQRCRIVAAGNPPTRPEGLWVTKRWGAWIDPKHPNPAAPGELRWYTMGEEGVEVEVDGRGPHIIRGEEVFARSRTFIPSELSDNPDLAATNYSAALASLPEELRLAYRDGDFSVGLRDEPFQAIPSNWLVEAQNRWTRNPPHGVPMCCMGVDVAQGGSDKTVLAIRHDGWFAPLTVIPGSETKDGPSVAGAVVKHRRDECKVVIDIGGGWGGDAYAHLKSNSVDVSSYMGVKSSTKHTRDNQLKFFNIRTEAYWRFREALDPSQPQGSTIMLPQDPELISDLCAPRYSVIKGGSSSRGVIKLESKEDVCKRLSRSTDRGDAVIMAWWEGVKQVQLAGGDWKGARVGRMTPKVIMGRAAARRNR